MGILVTRDQEASKTEELVKFKSMFLPTEYETAHQRDCSFTTARMIVKGWCFTVLSGIFYFLVDKGLLGKDSYHMSILIIISFFWFLELILASNQRIVLDRIVYIENMIEKCKNSQDLKDTIEKEKIPYLFGKNPIRKARGKFLKVFCRPTIFFFYLALILANLFLWQFFSDTTTNGLILNDKIAYASGARNYILSSISQGLAAIFALVFTVTLVMTQISSRYSIRLTHVVLSKKTKFLMLFFVIGIIIPLIVMQLQGDVLLYLCIGWTIVCISFLIYYFFDIVRQLDPKSNIEFILKSIDENFVSSLREKYEEWWKEGPPYVRDETSSKFWFNIPDDPLQIVLQIMISAMKDGDYETFTFGLEKIKNAYDSTVKKDNERYLPFHFINILTRCGKKTISENDDFLLLQVCFTLKDIAFINAQRKISYTSDKISSLLASYMEIAFTQKNFSGIVWDIIRIFKNIADEYVNEGLEVSFDVHVSYLVNTSTKIAKRVSEEELNDYLNFIYMLAFKAIHGGSSSNYGLEILVSIISDIGIENAERELTMPSRAGVPNINFGELSVNMLKNLLKLTNERKGFDKIRGFIENCINEHVSQKEN